MKGVRYEDAERRKSNLSLSSYTLDANKPSRRFSSILQYRSRAGTCLNHSNLIGGFETSCSRIGIHKVAKALKKI